MQRPCGRKGQVGGRTIKATDQDKEVGPLNLPRPLGRQKTTRVGAGRSCLCSDRGPRSLPPSIRPPDPPNLHPAFPEATPIPAARAQRADRPAHFRAEYSPSASCPAVRGGDPSGRGLCSKGQSPWPGRCNHDYRRPRAHPPRSRGRAREPRARRGPPRGLLSTASRFAQG